MEREIKRMEEQKEEKLKTRWGSKQLRRTRMK